MKRLEMMKETLMNCVQSQLGDLSSVDAKELGEAVDMIKDLSEAIYYCTITESMKENKEEKNRTVMHYPVEYYPMYRDMDKPYGRMYYDGGNTYYSGSNGSNGQGNDSRNYPIELRDYREGRSPMTRKTYMERKMHGGAKEAQMHELEKYMKELSEDITEMIEGASTEEKQMLKNKISALANKIV